MNAREFYEVVCAMQTFYPKDNLLPDRQSIQLWYSMLSDIPAAVLTAALRLWVENNRWPPTIADLREYSLKVTGRTEKTWDEGWKEVCTAIGRYGYGRAEAAFKSMSPVTAKAVESLGWMNLCCSEDAISDRANFRRIYEIIAKREQEKALLDPTTKLQMQTLIAAGAHERNEKLLEEGEKNE